MKLLITSFVFLLGNFAYGQCGYPHRSISYYRPYNFAPHVEIKKEVIIEQVITPVAIPVLVPAFQFQYVPPPCQQNMGNQGYAPQNTGYPGSPQGYPPQVPQPTAAVNNVSDDARIRRLIRQVIREELKNAMNGTPPPNDQDDGPPAPVSGQQQSLNYVSILGGRCSTCHTAGNLKGNNFVMFTSPGVFNNSADKRAIVKAMESGEMPLAARTNPAARVPPNEIAIVKQSFGIN